MLTRKCEKSIRNLLGVGDFNVRMTVVKKQTSRFIVKSIVDGVWRETFRDAIGSGIIHDSENTYLISCQTEQKSVDFATSGDKIIEECWELIQKADAVRINVTKFPTEKNKLRSWIIARE